MASCDDLGRQSHPAVAAAVAALTPSTEALRDLVRGFRSAMADGLAGRPSSLKMLPTFVEQPRGDERGRVVVVDWGGTNARVSVIELGGGDARVVTEDDFPFSESDRTGSADRVFDVIAGAVERVVRGESGPLPLGLVYSFPARLERVDRALALPLTKGWRTFGLEGHDVVELLRVALGRRGLGRVTVAAVANDTVAALILQSYRIRGHAAAATPAEVGLILGTGTNQAADLPGAGIRNLESGNFDGVGTVAAPWDRALDRALADPVPGAQRFEKMAAGRYLGEILRRAIVDLGRSTPLFRWPGSAMDTPWSLDTVRLSAVAEDESKDLSRTDEILRTLGAVSTLDERVAVRDLARAVGGRAARLVAAGLYGTLTFIDPDLHDEHTVAVDGGVYGGYPGFDERVRDGVRELAGAERAGRVRLAYVKDSTSAGAAVIAAVAARRQR
jgi:hexokinase